MTDSARFGFFPIVAGDDVRVERAYTLGAMSSGNLTLAQGGASFVAAAGDVDISQGGAWGLVSAGDVTMNQAGAVGAVAGSISVKDGFVGMAVGRDVTLQDTTVLLTGAQAAAFGLAFGLVVALARLIFGGSGSGGSGTGG